MAKIKHTKTELKAQSDALSRYKRFLPMLQLKKQQLQAEIASITLRIEKLEEQQTSVRENMESWVELFADPDFDPTSMIRLKAVETDVGNIAGVVIPIFNKADVERETPDLFDSPPWIDEALDRCDEIIQLREEAKILYEQRQCVAEELRITSQRVNLFEKVKIPECQENIRVIKIYLGDEQTAAVVRGKIAKRRTTEREAEEAAA